MNTPDMTFTNSKFIFSNNSSMTIDNSFVSDGSSFILHDGSQVKSSDATGIKASNVTLKGDAWAKANDKVIIENSSSVVVGGIPTAVPRVMSLAALHSMHQEQ